MIRRWLAERSEQELRNILSEAVMEPFTQFNMVTERRCLLGAACQATLYRSGEFPPLILHWKPRKAGDGLPYSSTDQNGEVYPALRFNALCVWADTRWGSHARITRLIHEACLRELVRRGPAVPAPVPVLEEANV